MGNSIVTVEHLYHRYSTQWAVKDLNFAINRNGVVGLLGSNGAGKSTTMNIVCGILKPTSGNVFINGINMREKPVEAKQYIGFLPQQPPLYMDLTVEEYLKHAAFLRLMSANQASKAVEYVLEKCALTHFRDRIIKNLSGGYQQRVGIAQAIVHNPKFVVLDEPTNGLDPNQIVDIRNLIREIAEDHVILLSTHILSEVQAVCDSIEMIESGKLVFSGSMEDFDNYVAPESFIIELGRAPRLSVLKMINGDHRVDELGNGRFRIFLRGESAVTEKYIKASVENDWDLKELMVERCALNEIFARLSNEVKNEN